MTWRKAKNRSGYFWMNMIGLMLGLSLVELLILTFFNALNLDEPWIPSMALALMILMVVTFGYANFFALEVRKRYKEAGLRKLYGAGPKHITEQFIFESLLLVFISVLLSLVLAELIEPYFNDLYELSCSIRSQSVLFQLLLISGLTLWLGVLGAIIPVLRFARTSINEIVPNLKAGTSIP